MWDLLWVLAATVVSYCSAKLIPVETKTPSLLRAEKKILSWDNHVTARGDVKFSSQLNRTHDTTARGGTDLSATRRTNHSFIEVQYLDREGRRAAESEVLQMARSLLQTFQAGAGYQERVWIRDSATFLGEALEAGVDHQEAKNVLLHFFFHQGEDGNIVDWYIPSTGETDKNTVATDQETSLVQAVHTYVKHTGDLHLLHLPVRDYHGMNHTLQERIERAFEYLFQERLSSEHHLIYGATTVDWGDVQPEHPEGVYFSGGSIYLDGQSHPSLDVYDNAMIILAMKNYAELCDMDKNLTCADRWSSLAKTFSERTRNVLWDNSRQKWRPHVYLSPEDQATKGRHSGSPFPSDLDEDSIYYHGGTTAAILAGLHDKEETKHAYEKMRHNAELAGLRGPLTVGLTDYPPYPVGAFGNLQNEPYGYQNGGDWPWWGGRTVQALVQMGLLEEASAALAPMITRSIQHGDFFEWYDRYNRPQGSSRFHGAAGAIAKAVHMLHEAEDAKAKPQA